MPAIGNHLYNVAKAGVVMMTKSLALELAEWGVRVNCVCPGYVATGLAAGDSLSELRSAGHVRAARQDPRADGAFAAHPSHGRARRRRLARHVPRVR